MFKKSAAPAAAGGYTIAKSLRFRSSASAYLNRTFSSTPSTYTISVWVKRGQLGSTQVIAGCRNAAVSSSQLYFNSSDQLYFANDTNNVTTTAVFRDPAAWYHIVLRFTLNGTAYLYVNNNQVASLVGTGSTNYMFTSASGFVNAIGRSGDSSSNYLDGYLAEFNFVDGQSLTPTSFGSTNSTTGVWQPIAYTGTYGTNGFYLKFTDTTSTTTLCYDYSGNSNNWTPNNISLTAGSTYDSMTDVPTLTSATTANYAVLNPIYVESGVTLGTITNGNLKLSSGGSASQGTGTLAVTSGQFYYEATIGQVASSTNSWVGFTQLPWGSYNKTFVYAANGQYYNGSAFASYGATYTAGDVIGVAIDVTNSTITFYKNNTSQGQKTSLAISGLPMTVASYLSTSGDNISFNFGQQPFTYTPPTGYVALNTYNLPTSTIVAGNQYMDATTYTGTGSTQSITNAGAFKPDLVWVKSRSAATDHKLTDSVRGVTKALISDTTGAETTDTNGLTAFGANGFTLGTDTNYNNNAATYVGWQWQAGQGTTSSNTNGSVTSTVSVNLTAGFSIATCTTPATNTNFTVGHGLGVAPAFIIVKNRTSTNNWTIYHQSTGAGGYLLFTTAAFGANTDTWANTAPTSTVWSSNTPNWWATSQNLVAYCWAQVAGFSQFGTFASSGSADGSFVYTGFRPKYILIKPTTGAGGNWIVQDTSRDPYNVSINLLNPDNSGAEYTASALQIDILSNGFKIRGTWAGYTLNPIYAAFAENPFKYALAR